MAGASSSNALRSPLPQATSNRVRFSASVKPILMITKANHAAFRARCYDHDRAGYRVNREQILAKLRERIVLFAASHLSRDAAEDLAQEVLMLLHEKYAHLERAEDLLPLS